MANIVVVVSNRGLGHISVSDRTICPHHFFAWHPLPCPCLRLNIEKKLSQSWQLKVDEYEIQDFSSSFSLESWHASLYPKKQTSKREEKNSFQILYLNWGIDAFEVFEARVIISVPLQTVSSGLQGEYRWACITMHKWSKAPGEEYWIV